MFGKFLICILLWACIGLLNASDGLAQDTATAPKKINFGYSQNPKIKSKTESDNKPESNPKNVEQNLQAQSADATVEKRIDNLAVGENNAAKFSIAKKTLAIAKRASLENISPTEIYKVGVGDTLFISLQNETSSSANFYTVLNDGTIDYPLAGQMLTVVSLTSDEIEDLLKEKIKLFQNPKISVKVREPASHSVTVLGLADKTGEKYLPREAMPLYFIRAETVVQSKANQVVIKRSKSEPETLDLNEAKNDNVLIFPGDIVEFKYQEIKQDNLSKAQYFYIGGNVVSVGQKEFSQGLTLTQAILLSGGLRKLTVKKIIIRRKNNEGLLITTEINLKAVNDGKTPDPILEAGDTIEVGN